MSAQPEAAWYPDPNDGSTLRWWDGSAWTNHVHKAVVSDTRSVLQPLDALVRDDAAWELYPNRTGEPVLFDAQAATSNARKARVILALILAAGLLLFVFATPVFIVLCFALGAYPFIYAKRNAAKMNENARHYDAALAKLGLSAIGDGATFTGKSQGRSFGDRSRFEIPGLSQNYPFSLAHEVEISGTAWNALGSVHLRDTEMRSSNKTEQSITHLTIPLPAEVAERYPGMLAVGCSRDGLRKKAIRKLGPRDFVDCHGWHELDLNLPDNGLQFQAWLSSDQDPIAVLEMFDPAWMVELGDRFTGHREITPLRSELAVLMADGYLSVFVLSHLIQAYRGQSLNVMMDGITQLNSFYELASRFHRRAIEEWR